MLKKINPTHTEAWKRLKLQYDAIGPVHLKELFNENPGRAVNFSMHWEDFFIDFSKTHINRETLRLLIDLARECGLNQSIMQQFEGSIINETESRAVLHTALRCPVGTNTYCEGKEVQHDIHGVLKQMESFSNKIRNGEWKGYSGKSIKHIVNIGIGGSDLGPVMVCNALKHYRGEGPDIHFVSNVDGSHLSETLKDLPADQTLFMIVSKTFTTQETMANAHSAKNWFLNKGGTENQVSSHFVAVSTNVEAVKSFGIDPENMFRFWDFVGGRFSLWSAVGLSIAVYTGFANFKKLLEGAHAIDEHFKNVPFDENIPVILGMLSIWYTNFFGCATEAILPYDQYLDRLPAYLQQAVMESNGKSIDRSGENINYATSPILWGEPGTNGQHSFYQLIHQGTQMIPCIFMAPARPLKDPGGHHNMLLSNYFAQSEALMMGKTAENVSRELKNKGLSKEEIEKLTPYKTFNGNIPSISILYKELTPFNLGALIAMFEHRIFVQGIIWNIYSYDQWGVELGKELAGKILPELQSESPITTHDSSTNQLINRFKDMRIS